MDMCCKPLIWCQQCHVKRVFLHTNTFPFSLISLHISLRPVLALTSKVADFSSYWIFQNFYHYLFFATYTLFICRCAIFSHNLNKCVLWVLSCVSWRHWTSHTPRSFSLLHIRWKYMDLVISSLRLWLLLQLRCKYFRIHRWSERGRERATHPYNLIWFAQLQVFGSLFEPNKLSSIATRLPIVTFKHTPAFAA